MDRKALIGLLSGVTVVIATLIGVAMVNPRAAEGADVTAKAAPHACGHGSKPVDSGYAVPPTSDICAPAE